MLIIVNSEKNKKSQKHGIRIFDKDFSLFKKINSQESYDSTTKNKSSKIPFVTVYDFLRLAININYFLIKEPLKEIQNEILIPEF
jgi:hypothetical protein